VSGDNGSTTLRNHRRRRKMPRAITESPKDIRKNLRKNDELQSGIDIPDSVFKSRPSIWGDCKNAKRPCPWVGCKHHLYLDVNPETGAIKINFPGLEPWELGETCSLDVSEDRESTLDEIGNLMNLSRERIRQIETIISKKLRPHFKQKGITPSRS